MLPPAGPRSRSSRLPLVALAAVIASSWFADPAAAIPAFARKYQMTCLTCHAPFPRLQPFGEAFAARGFRLAPVGQPETIGTVETGDPELQLQATVPLAVRFEAHGVVRDEATAKSDFESPWLAKLLTGGPITSKLSYYAYFIMEKGGVQGLEDAYLHFSHLFGSKIDVLVGQFQVSDPLFKRELRLERADYEIYRRRIGAARANLTYERGLMFLATAPGNVDVAFEVVNGNGIPEDQFDNDSNKNLALRLSRDVGRLRVGLFGYWGRETGAGVVHEDEIVYFGPDLTLGLSERFELNLQYLERRDSDPYFLGASRAVETTTRGGFLELLFFPGGMDGKWTYAALYNQIDSDDPLANYEDLALSAGYSLARNVRLITEVGRNFELDQNRLSFGVVTAF